MSSSTHPLTEARFQEDDLTDECKDLISSLPRGRGWIFKHLYKYEGFWIPARFLLGLLSCKKHFQARDSDIILVSTPKSGTTWLKAMAFALLNRSRFHDPQQHPLLARNPHDIVPFLETKLYNRKDLPDLSPFVSPRVFATHVPVGSLPRSIQDSSCKIVYICRDPKDVFVSYWHYSSKLRPKEWGTNKLEDMFDLFCNGVSPYGPFWDHVLGYKEESLQNPKRMLFLKYEEIKEQPASHLKKLANFMGCSFSPEEEAKGTVDEILKLCSFDHLSNLEVNKITLLNESFFRKGEVGDWASVLTPEMVKRIDHITEQKMHTCGFKF